MTIWRKTRLYSPVLTNFGIRNFECYGIEHVDVSARSDHSSNTVGVTCVSRLFGRGATCSLLLLTLLLSNTWSNIRGSCSCNCGCSWCCWSRRAKLWVGCIVGRNVLVKLLASFVGSVHIWISVATSTANTDQLLLLDFMSDLRSFALLATHILHDELVQMTFEIS